MSSQGRPTTPKRKPKRQPDSRTKFDVWLESQLTDGLPVVFLFKNDPINPNVGTARYECMVITVDRYTLYLEISLGEDHVPMWVTKDNIISAS